MIPESKILSSKNFTILQIADDKKDYFKAEGFGQD